MKDYTKRYIRDIRLNSFHPLCETAIGKKAVDSGFPPFIDGSCRREPDFEHPFPSITSLCRQESFAPHLHENCIVAYITVKGKWSTTYAHHRLVAILEVIKRRESHQSPAAWYMARGLNIPSNCMVDDNPPHLFAETAGNYKKGADIKKFLAYPPEKQKLVGEGKVRSWNKEYMNRSKKSGVFIISRPVYVNLTDPPILTQDAMASIFGKVPNTRNPNIIGKEEFKALAYHAGINFIYQ